MEFIYKTNVIDEDTVKSRDWRSRKFQDIK